MLGYGTELSFTKSPKLDGKLTTAFTANDEIPAKNVLYSFHHPLFFSKQHEPVRALVFPLTD